MAVLGATTLTGCNSIPAFIESGSRMIFEQSSAPPSWTKLDTHDNKALRVVNGTATPGGSTAFTSVFTSRTPAGSVILLDDGAVGDTTLSTPQIPSHAHTNGAAYPGLRTVALPVISTPTYTPPGYFLAGPSNTGATVGDGAHNHPFTVGTGSFSGTPMDFAVSYVDVIICSKD
jgi:hypothetical protein